MISFRHWCVLLAFPLLAGCGARDGDWARVALEEQAVVLLDHGDVARDAAVQSILSEAFPRARRLRAEQLVTAGPGLRHGGEVLVVPSLRTLTPVLWGQLTNHVQRGGLVLFWGRDPEAAPGDVACLMLRPATESFALASRVVRGTRQGRFVSNRPIPLQSPLRRPAGTPGAEPETIRWIPLAEALDAAGVVRGWPASLMIEQVDGAPPAAWGWIGWDAGEDHERPLVALLREAAHRLHQSQFLLPAGLDRYVVEPGGAFDLEAVVANGKPDVSAWRLTAELENEAGVVTRRIAEPLSAGEPVARLAAKLFLGTAPRQLDGGSTVRLRMGLWDAAGQTLLDEVTQTIRLLPEPPSRATAADERIGVRGSSFIIGRRPLALIGAAYAPALADRSRSPLDAAHFDPARMRSELGLFRDAGFNVVALRYTRVEEAPQIRHLVDELRDRQLWALLELPALAPWAPDWEAARAQLAALRLGPAERYVALSPGTVEPPRAGVESDRVAAAWRTWLLEQYGSLAHAEQVLGGDPLAAPPAAWWTEAGRELPQGLRLAAHRFLEDQVGRHYGACARFLREQGWPGLFTARSGMVLDPAAGAHHLDFLTLDGGDITRHEPGRIEFHTAYARAVSGGKPVLWMDLRATVPYPPAEAQLREQAATIDSNLRALLQSQAAGFIYGGFAGGPLDAAGRDDGLLNPDATWRPAGDALRARAQDWRRLPAAPPPWRGREVETAGQPDGLAGAWRHWRERYAEEAQAGRVEELRPAGWGRPSRELPAEGLGGAPHLDPAPLRHLNAEWIPPVQTTSGVARTGLRQAVKLDLINTGLATWSPSVTGHTGAVWIHARSPSGRIQQLGIRETPPGGRQSLMWTPADPGEWTLRPWLHPAGPFGELLTVHVAP